MLLLLLLYTSDDSHTHTSSTYTHALFPSATDPDGIESLGLTFTVSFSPGVGPAELDLRTLRRPGLKDALLTIPLGSETCRERFVPRRTLRATTILSSWDQEQPVTADNVDLFVQLYCDAVLRHNCEPQLRAMRNGLYEFVPPAAFSGCDPHDFDLLVGGQAHMSLDDLKSRTVFTGTGTGGAGQPLVVKWFWQVVDKMTQAQRSKLLYFATGTGRLPAGTGRALTVDVYTPSTSSRAAPLPTATTCSRKLNMPVFSSFATLRSKLLLAVEGCENYELD